MISELSVASPWDREENIEPQNKEYRRGRIFISCFGGFKKLKCYKNEYYEGYMPKVGCHGCNNYTMEYVGKD